MSDLPFREKNNDRRVATLLLLGLVVLFGAVYVAGYFFTSDKVPRGTTVSGVDIGGLRPAAARATLTEELGPRAEQPIVVSADRTRHRIDPADAGLAVDYDESVSQAGAGRSWNPARMWDFFTGGGDLEAVVSTDEEALEKALASFARRLSQPTVEGRITFSDGEAEPQLPRTGQELDLEAAVDDVTEVFLDDDREVVPLPVLEVEPDVTEADVRRGMDEFANPAMAAPVTLRLAGENIVLRPEDFSAALSMKSQNGTMVPVLDAERLLAAVEPAMRTVALSPVDATVRIIDGRPQVVPGKNGVTFRPKQITDQFLSLVVQRDENRTLKVRSVVDKPDFGTQAAKRLKITEVVSDFTTYYPHADYRNTNLGRAAQLVNGTVLRPGETFSLNGTVGERTKANGFTKGFIISDGVYKEDFGGGVSQVATTLFNAAFFAGLEDVEHKPHSFYIDRYPVGREATVAWGAVDLRFKNDTPYGVLIQASIDPSDPSTSGAMKVRMWSTKYWDITAGVSDRYDVTEEETRHLQGEECVPNEGYGGFDIDVFRNFRRAGSDELIRRETMHTTYLPSDTVVCGPKPS